MKLNGKTPGRNKLEIVIRRQGGDFVFIAQTVLDMDSFEKLCPEPEPPVMKKPGGKEVRDVENPTYKAALADRNAKRTAYLVINSIRETPELEWEKVDYSDSNTWEKWSDEMVEAGLSDAECTKILLGCMRANGITDESLDEARESFLPEA